MCRQGNSEAQVYPLYQHLDLIQVNGKERIKAFVGQGCERVCLISFYKALYLENRELQDRLGLWNLMAPYQRDYSWFYKNRFPAYCS